MDDEELSTEEESEQPEPINSTNEMHLIPQDTPIRKAKLSDLEYEQQLALIETLQARRIKFREFKTKAGKSRNNSIEKDNHAKAAQMDKLLEKYDRLLEALDKNFTKLEQVWDELQVHRITLGDND